MHEKEKLKEAQYFLSQLRLTLDNPEDFKYTLSAFLSAARCVLQYAHDEAKGNVAATQWYNSKVSCSQIIGFFRDKRDINIHVSPVTFNTGVHAKVYDSIRIGDSLTISVVDKDGNIIQQQESEPEWTEPPPLPENEIRYIHTFSDWGANDNIEALSVRYLQELIALVNDGISKGYISG